MPDGCIFDHYTVRGQAITGDKFTMGSYDGSVGIVFSVDQSVVSRVVTGYGDSEGGYVLIASPVGMVSPGNVTNMLANSYDLYRFNQAADMEWENYKQEGDNHHFDLEAGRGYLYANSNDVTLVFPGVPYSGDGEITLNKANGGEFAGWNLVGNPFTQTAYTGNDVDLLATPSYTFESKVTDYESRFKLVFAMNDENNQNNNDNFAFFHNGQLIVNGEGVLQIFDALGRQLFSKELSTLNSQLSTPTAPGVYVLRLINGADVKTQKIVVR